MTQHRKATYPFGPGSLAGVLAQGLQDFPDRIALVDGQHTWTWRELENDVSAAAARLVPSNRVAWLSGNTAESIIGALATWRAGAVWIGIDPRLPKRSIDVMAKRSRANLIVRNLDELDTRPQHENPEVIDPHAEAVVSFTSGTTGDPKAVLHSQHGLLAPGLVSIEEEPPQPGERIGTSLSLANATILALGPISSLLRGSTFVVQRSSAAVALAESIRTNAVTRLFAVPTTLYDLLADRSITRQDLASLDRIVLGGGKSDPELVRTFLDRFGVRATSSYGLAEAPAGVVRERVNDEIGSGRGFPLPHVSISIRGRNDEMVPSGDPGEVCIEPQPEGRWARSWTGTLGYLDDPESTVALWRHGSLHTGDAGYIDADGAVVITGRLDRTISRGGAKIDPATIEAAATTIFGSSEVLAFGIADDRLGSKTVLAMNTPPGETAPDASEVTAALREVLDHHHLPDHLLMLDALPRNALGKFDRAALSNLL